MIYRISQLSLIDLVAIAAIHAVFIDALIHIGV